MNSSGNPFRETGIDPNVLRNIDIEKMPKVLGLYQKAISLGLHPDTGADSNSTDMLVGINNAIETIETSPDELVQTWLKSIQSGRKSKIDPTETQEERYEPSPFFEKYTNLEVDGLNFWTPAVYVVSDPLKHDELRIVEFDGKITTIQKALSVGNAMHYGNSRDLHESIEFGKDCQPLVNTLYGSKHFSLVDNQLASRNGLLVVKEGGDNFIQSRISDFRIDNPLGDSPELVREFKPGVYSIFSTPVEAILKNYNHTPEEVSGPTFGVINLSAKAIGRKVDADESIIGFVPSETVDKITESMQGRYDTSPFSSRGVITGSQKRQLTNSLNFDDSLSKWMLEQQIQPKISVPTVNRLDRPEKLHLVLASNGGIKITGEIVMCVPAK